MCVAHLEQRRLALLRADRGKQLLTRFGLDCVTEKPTLKQMEDMISCVTSLLERLAREPGGPGQLRRLPLPKKKVEDLILRLPPERLLKVLETADTRPLHNLGLQGLKSVARTGKAGEALVRAHLQQLQSELLKADSEKHLLTQLGVDCFAQNGTLEQMEVMISRITHLVEWLGEEVLEGRSYFMDLSLPERREVEALVVRLPPERLLKVLETVYNYSLCKLFAGLAGLRPRGIGLAGTTQAIQNWLRTDAPKSVRVLKKLNAYDYQYVPCIPNEVGLLTNLEALYFPNGHLSQCPAASYSVVNLKCLRSLCSVSGTGREHEGMETYFRQRRDLFFGDTAQRQLLRQFGISCPTGTPSLGQMEEMVAGAQAILDSLKNLPRDFPAIPPPNCTAEELVMRLEPGAVKGILETAYCYNLCKFFATAAGLDSTLTLEEATKKVQEWLASEDAKKTGELSVQLPALPFVPDQIRQLPALERLRFGTTTVVTPRAALAQLENRNKLALDNEQKTLKWLARTSKEDAGLANAYLQRRCDRLLVSDQEKRLFEQFGISCPSKEPFLTQMQAMVASVETIMNSLKQELLYAFPGPVHRQLLGYSAEALVMELPPTYLQELLETAYRYNLYKIFALPAGLKGGLTLEGATKAIKEWLATEKPKEIQGLRLQLGTLTCLPAEIGRLIKLQSLTFDRNLILRLPAASYRALNLHCLESLCTVCNAVPVHMTAQFQQRCDLLFGDPATKQVLERLAIPRPRGEPTLTYMKDLVATLDCILKEVKDKQSKACPEILQRGYTAEELVMRLEPAQLQEVLKAVASCTTTASAKG